MIALTRSKTPQAARCAKERSTFSIPFRESSMSKISPTLISGMYRLPQIPAMVLRFPPIILPVTLPLPINCHSFG
ncbi:Uncharacterised protein [Vibrio cholerae]|nr:Uncharacterised protein [Vibrio cholerae]